MIKGWIGLTSPTETESISDVYVEMTCGCCKLTVKSLIWQFKRLQKTTVPEPIVAELVALVKQVEEKFYTDNLNIEEFRYLSAFLYNRAVKALTRYEEWKKSNEII